MSDYRVLWPLGTCRIDSVDPLRSLDDLNGKIIAFVWDYVFKGAEMWQLIKREIVASYPNARFVDYDIFGNIQGPADTVVVAAVPDRLREYRVDAAIVGVGA